MIVWDVIRIYEDMEPQVRIRMHTRDNVLIGDSKYHWTEINGIPYGILARTVSHVEVDVEEQGYMAVTINARL